VTAEPIPVLLYHSVSRHPSSWIAPFTVDPGTFRRHLDLIAGAGRTALTVSALRAGIAGGQMPARPVLITFDDGFADTLEVAAPLLAGRGLPATVYLTTGFLGGRSPGGDAMLSWAGVAELGASGCELGAHSATHPQLDTLPRRLVHHEVAACKARLEEHLGAPVPSFAYPHGYSTPWIRRLVAEVGYQSACAVRNTFSSRADAPFAIARLMITAGIADGQVRDWLTGRGAPPAGQPDRLRSRVWRTYRRSARLLGKPR
jgi:peptidoglycan/xylan/chitin deacetylase (PgdA/CDA1 family)